MEAHGRPSGKETNQGNELCLRKYRRQNDLRKFVSLTPSHPSNATVTNRPGELARPVA